MLLEKLNGTKPVLADSSTIAELVDDTVASGGKLVDDTVASE
jgi:hypothetical protein